VTHRRRRFAAILEVVHAHSARATATTVVVIVVIVVEEQHVGVLGIAVHDALHAVPPQAVVYRPRRQLQPSLPPLARHGRVLVGTRVQVPVRSDRLYYFPLD